ncbi:UNVERIFIED_CONTAM: putative alpha-mannosidase [Sesamum radiatum]|uniref:alpha-mannosidase n=1 Tax=Sesamum radiatum TaxID=300843 RepID=A0AAW2RAX7_SESRA
MKKRSKEAQQLVMMGLLLLFLIELVHCKYMVYNTSQAIVPDKLNVHLVPHTHDDVGWLKTVDQYYVGSNNSIQGACVQNVLDSLVSALLADKNRRFIYVEQIFAGAFPENYEPPSGFYFEVNDASPIVQDDITLFDYNVQERVEDFVAAALTQAVRQLEFFKGRNRSGSSTDLLGDALAIAQHHDAVTGTEQQHVANDYAKRLSMGYVEVMYEDIAVRDSAGRVIESQLVPLSDTHVSLRNYHVKAYLGQTPRKAPKYWLAFTASAPPLGFSTYTISSAKTKGAGSARSSIQLFQDSDRSTSFEVGHEHLKLIFSFERGKLAHYVNHRSGVNESIQQSFSFYSGYNGSDEDPQSSGAYVFRPNGTFAINPQKQGVTTVMRGPIIDEVHQVINPWIYQINRLHKGKEHVEVEFSVGPIPVDDGIGKEVATQITTNLESNKTFYTDSNGRDFIKRIRDYRADWDLKVNEPAAGNYYPINLGIYVKDNKKELSVLVDRAVGGSSLVDGQIELMLHRRLLRDDGKGVAEALNETVCIDNQCKGLTIQGKYYYKIDKLGEGAKWRRSAGQEIYSPFLLAFTEQDEDNWMSSHVPTFSAIDSSYSLPDNVAILTLQELTNKEVLLRLAHLYEIGEDKELSVMSKVELKKLFQSKKIGKVVEMSLSGNQERSEMEKKRLVWKAEGWDGESKLTRGGAVDPGELLVELAPMEIRTFVIHFDDMFVQDVGGGSTMLKSCL